MVLNVHIKPPQYIHVNNSLEDNRLFDVLSRQEATTTGIQQRELDERVITGYYRTKNINYKQRGNIVSLARHLPIHVFSLLSNR